MIPTQKTDESENIFTSKENNSNSNVTKEC